MSNRERWVIYPLLFFAFCLAARDQFPYMRPEVVKISRLSCRVIDAEFIDTKQMVATQLRAESIESRKNIEGDVMQLNLLNTGKLVCNRVILQSTEGRRVAELGSTHDGSGQLVIRTADEAESIVIAAQQESGKIESRHDNGLRMVIRATKGGGELYVIDAESNVVAQFDVPPTTAGPDGPSPDPAHAATPPASGEDTKEDNE